MAEKGQSARLIVPVVDGTATEMRASMEHAARAGADMVEVRLDHLEAVSGAELRSLLTEPPCPVLVTCRSAKEGGRFAGTDAERVELLAAAMRAGGQMADIEMSTLDEAGPLLEELKGRGLVVSAHDFAGRPGDLAGLLARMEGSPGSVNKLAFMAAGPEDAWAAMDFLRSSVKPAMALAMGEAGLASRILAKKFGAFGTFAAIERGAESAPGQPTLLELRELYRWDSIGAETSVFGVIGCPVGHSMSPAVHNAAFSADGVDAVYMPLRVEPSAECFSRFIDAILERPWCDVKGLSITIPHKEHALARVGAENVDELSRAIGAVNTIVFTGEARRPMVGFNTDYSAAIESLVEAMGCGREALAGVEAAVLGAGGAARAIVAGLSQCGARTTIYNRTVSRGEELSRQFDRPGGSVKAAGMEAVVAARPGIVINCTPIGMHPQVEGCPLPEGFAYREGMVVFDTIYNPVKTELLKRAEAAGCVTVSGVEMFINQAAAQYELWLGRKAPRAAMREALVARLGAR